MSRHLRFPKWAMRSERSSNRQNALARSVHHRRLVYEALEDRRLLSVGASPELPGMHMVDPNLGNLHRQRVSFDFAGARGKEAAYE
jgi:hypothetical protein